MKKGTTCGLIALLTVLVMFNIMSCSDDADNLDFSPQSFSYKVGSATYSGGFNVVRYTDSSPALKMEFYQKSVYENFLYIEIEGANYLPPRQYRAGYDSTTGTNIQLRYFTNGSHPYSATSGQLTITTFDTVNHKISGTFKFTGNYVGEIRQINEGRFDNLEYIRQ